MELGSVTLSSPKINKQSTHTLGDLKNKQSTHTLAGWVADFIYVCLKTRWLGQKPWFLSPGLLLKDKCLLPSFRMSA